VGFGEGDAELPRAIGARQVIAHPVGRRRGAAVGERVRRAFGTVAVAVDADLCHERAPFQPRDRVVQRPAGAPDEAVVPSLPDEAEHLVRVHVALAEQPDHDDAERRDRARGILHRASPASSILE
jgi:hypothetical protein